MYRVTCQTGHFSIRITVYSDLNIVIKPDMIRKVYINHLCVCYSGERYTLYETTHRDVVFTPVLAED